MKKLPNLETDRLLLRPFEIADAGRVAALAGENGLTLAITRNDDTLLIGSIGLVATSQHNRAELGYWTGKNY